ncbi:MAG: hypothetical protein [Arizlama microvirus]|nr:MAG: hypothetical protein [Arizlama microvirus]
MFFKRRRNSYSSKQTKNKQYPYRQTDRPDWGISNNYSLIETYSPNLQRRKSKLAWQSDLSMTHRYVNKPSLNYQFRNAPKGVTPRKSLSAIPSSPRVNQRTTQTQTADMPSFREPDSAKRVTKRDELDCDEAVGGHSKKKQRFIILHNGSGKRPIKNREPC